MMPLRPRVKRRKVNLFLPTLPTLPPRRWIHGGVDAGRCVHGLLRHAAKPQAITTQLEEVELSTPPPVPLPDDAFTRDFLVNTASGKYHLPIVDRTGATGVWTGGRPGTLAVTESRLYMLPLQL